MKRMEWARAQGLAKPGPGRPSRACLDAIEEARRGGMVFDDDVPAKPVVSREAPAKVPVTRKPETVAGESKSMMADTRVRYDMDAEFTGKDSRDKKQTVNVAAVCRRTGYSILGCYCTGPGHEVLVPSMEVIIVNEKR